MRSNVSLQLLPGEEGFGTIFAFVRAQLQMLPLPVIDKRGKRTKAVAAIRTQETLLPGVDHHVNLALLEPGESFWTKFALERLLT